MKFEEEYLDSDFHGTYEEYLENRLSETREALNEAVGWNWLEDTMPDKSVMETIAKAMGIVPEAFIQEFKDKDG